jgi:hypothetical protein
MALTNQQRYQHTQDAELQNRMKAQIAKAAQFVLAGGAGITNFQIHTRARMAAASPEADLGRFMYVLAWNTEIAVSADITDPDIAFVVDSNYQAIWGS